MAKKGKKYEWELYDLQQDPLELTDLGSEQPDKRDSLVAKWKAESKRHSRQAALDRTPR